ncbi:uncharacterized protein PHALS_12715 [Plasmopara halstedii]|uniref:Uncharacterized protein n=1 Tax=Plasmopara halstedii TaxID=4781 RepID=A0A0P1ALX9_PLAHL|nr:uncharacterized protein PHALS_12715 [Plasmopara halstedii]CEG42438.1 hypothetical protein PHALS_12715 [Plasmopara halstedii]|eukprot:XP_024578807.1 hypothetical protein PHALS_12715 [Plasmopara halstedii]
MIEFSEGIIKCIRQQASSEANQQFDPLPPSIYLTPFQLEDFIHDRLMVRKRQDTVADAMIATSDLSIAVRIVTDIPVKVPS